MPRRSGKEKKPKYVVVVPAKAGASKAPPKLVKKARGPKTNYKVLEPVAAMAVASPVGKPFVEKTDAEIMEWFGSKDAHYRGQIAWYAELGGFTVPDYLRRCSATACACGYDGNPLDIHHWRNGVCKPPWQALRAKLIKPLEPQNDDDIPF